MYGVMEIKRTLYIDDCIKGTLKVFDNKFTMFLMSVANKYQ